jgi:hypothetical protein
MKGRILISLLFSLLLSTSGVYGQLGSKLKNKIKNATNAVAEKSIMSGLLGSGADIPHRDIYSFNGKIVMLLKTTDPDAPDESSVIEYTSYVNSENSDMAIEMKPLSGEGTGDLDGTSAMNMIYDKENNVMLVLVSGEGAKTAMATKLDTTMVPTDIDEESAEEYTSDSPDYVKTGTTKMVSGYKCDGYRYIEEGTTVILWVTKDMPFKADMKEMQKAGMPLYYQGDLFNGGMIMEMESTDEEGKVVSMTVTDVDSKIKKDISLVGYSIMGAGAQK